MRIMSCVMSTASWHENDKKEMQQNGPKHKVEKGSVTSIWKYKNKVCYFVSSYISRKKINNIYLTFREVLNEG
jgi:hypothetical protein